MICDVAGWSEEWPLSGLRVATDVVANMLVRGHYDGLENMSNGTATAAQLEQAIRAYGHRLIEPPAFAYDTLEVERVTDALSPTYRVTFPLWTMDEGRSRLTLTLRFVETDRRLFLPDYIGLTVRPSSAL